MDFTLNEEQGMLRDSAREFLKNECGKKVIKALEESETGFSRELWGKMAGLGWMGIVVPEAYGGVGMGLLDLAILFEEYGRAALNGPMLSSTMCTLAVLDAGGEDVKQALLPGLASGERVLSLAMEEPNVSCAPRFVGTRAEPSADGCSLRGTKVFVPYANVVDELLVVARSAGEPGDEDGLTLLAVDAGAPGIALTRLPTLSGDRQFEVAFDGVAAGASDRFGATGRALPAVRALLEKGAAIQCAEMLGGAQYELEITAEYCRTRVQFNRPIGAFQAVQHRMADMYMDVLGARLTTYQAMWRLDRGMAASREVWIAKAFSSAAARRVAFSAQQLHAGMGYDLDHELHYYYRRAKALELRLRSVPAALSALHAALHL